ncbi:energy-coupling factor transporter transmembrane component T family protein [Microlunatus sp. GCM10028923]|uniref:energy-coupling factor transporter transmembrane component T family protein n=1 Tax=Microlunatus sp. GCM10028923 TaxID=3273400 RepID=UPI00361EE722
MTSVLGRRNPAVKLALLFAVSVATLFLTDPYPLIIGYVSALAAIRLGARVPWRTLLAAQLPFLAFGVGLVAVNALSRPGRELLPELPVRVTVEGLTFGVALALRGLVIGVLTIGFLASTPPRDLMVSLVRQARLSPRYAYAILAGHRMLQAMPNRWATIRAAQAVRGPVRRDGRPRFGPRQFARAAFALLVASIRSSERTALALETRGLGDRPRTVWRPVPLGTADLVLAGGVALAITMIITGAALLLP